MPTLDRSQYAPPEVSDSSTMIALSGCKCAMTVHILVVVSLPADVKVSISSMPCCYITLPGKGFVPNIRSRTAHAATISQSVTRCKSACISAWALGSREVVYVVTQRARYPYDNTLSRPSVDRETLTDECSLAVNVQTVLRL